MQIGLSTRAGSVDDDTQRAAYEWLGENHKLLYWVARRCCRGRYDLVDELVGEFTDRVPRVWATWDGVSCTIATHMAVNLRWYGYKWMNRHSRAAKGCGSLPHVGRGGEIDSGEHLADVYAHDGSDVDAAEQVRYALGVMDPAYAIVMRLRALEGWTVDDIAHGYGVSHGTAVRWCREAREMFADAIRSDVGSYYRQRQADGD